MKRLAFLLSASLLGGCIFFTPPTGLRLGDHSQEFANLQTSQPTVSQVEFEVYQAKDFSVIYPRHWGLGKTEVPLTDQIISRVSAGQAATNGESEGVTVITINDPLDPDRAKALEALGQFVKASLAKSYPKDFQVLNEAAAKLGGEDGIYLEAKGKSEGDVEHHVLVQGTMHDNKGYVVTVSTVERLFETYRPLYEHVLKNFKFAGEAGPDAAATGEAQATAEAAAS